MNQDGAAQNASQGNTLNQSVFSGLSGNEMYCMDLVGLRPGNLLVGNSVFSMGVLGSLRTLGSTVIGGEVHAFTDMIQQGRKLSFNRLSKELQQNEAVGVTGVDSQLIFHGANAEFLSVGSALHTQKTMTNVDQPFTSSFDGQELFCLMDAGYAPRSFVFGNVAYSIGVTKGITGAFKTFVKGEVKQYTDIFNQTRHLALERIAAEAKAVGANSVMGIRTNILPYGGTGVQEMVMVGTAAQHPRLSSLNFSGVVTSDLTAEETWNIAKLGYAPVELVIGTSVYSIGLMGGLKSFLRGFVRGEVTEMTHLIYGAREESLMKVREQATILNADDVLGLRTYIYDLGGGLIEFLVIGTAVKRVEGLVTKSEQLPPQAIIRDKTTFVNSAELSYGVNLDSQRV